jgi:hypothetical protein
MKDEQDEMQCWHGVVGDEDNDHQKAIIIGGVIFSIIVIMLVAVYGTKSFQKTSPPRGLSQGVHQ